MKQHTISLSEAIYYEQRRITGWGRQLWELLRSVLINCRQAFPFFFTLSHFACYSSQINHHHLLQDFMKPTLFLCVVACYLSLQTQPERVTNRWLKFMLQRGIVSRLWSLYQHCPNTPGRRGKQGISGRGPHVALTSLLSLLANMWFIKAGSCVSYSMSARKGSLSCKGGFRASTSPQKYPVPQQVYYPQR